MPGQDETAQLQGQPDRDRRGGGDRQRLMLRTAKLRCRNGEYACVVHDVSESGLKLRLFHAHSPETHMFVELANGALFAIERRWTDGAFAGFRFSSPIDVEAFVREPNPLGRRPIRLCFQRQAVVKAGDGGGHAMLVNLSQHGACVEAGRKLAVKERVRLEVEGLPPRVGHVCWRRNFAHGIVFQESFSLEELAWHAFALQPYEAEQAATGAWASGEVALCA